MVVAARLNPGSPWAVRLYPATGFSGLSHPKKCQYNFGLAKKQYFSFSEKRKNQNFELLCENNNFCIRPARKRSENRLKACGKDRCKVCSLVDDQDIMSMVAYKKFNNMLHYDVNCEQKMVVYMIRCTHCNIVYVGETIRRLKKRISEHLYNIKQRKNSSSLVTHFNTCPGEVRISVIASLAENSNKAQLLEMENRWIRLLNSAFPFGLNENIKGYGIATDIMEPNEHRNPPYLNYKISGQHSIKRGARKRQNKAVSPHSYWESMREIATIQPDTEKYHKLYVTLKSFNKKSIQNCIHTSSFGDIANESEKELKLALVAMLSGWKDKPIRKNDEKPVKRFFMPYHRILDEIDVYSVLRDKNIVRSIPSRRYPEKFSVGFTFSRTISSFVCNHNILLKSLDKQKLRQLLQTDCHCEGNKYCYKPSGHVITGDLSIAEDASVIDLLKEGAKYRLTEKPKRNIVVKNFDTLMEQIIEWIVRNEKCGKEKLKRYKDKIVELFEKKYSRVRKDDLQEYKSLTKIKKKIEFLQQKYVITTADKAPNNFIFVCKSFYVRSICQEMGISLNERGELDTKGNQVYLHVSNTAREIVDEQIKLFSWIQGNITEENKVLPRLFANPKLHKNPYKFRFIAGARYSVSKSASIVLHRILVFFKEHFVKYCETIKTRTGVNLVWTTKGTMDVHNMFKNLDRRQISSIFTADFSTMFTMFEHNIILKNILALINLCFKNSGKQGVCISRNKVWYANESNNNAVIFIDQHQCYKLAQDVIQNTYVSFAGLNFKQIKGVPMGGNASPMLADLSLAMLEYAFLSKNHNVAREMRFTKRYIDDLLCIKTVDGTESVVNIADQIYPASLELSVTSKDNEATFLDSKIKINQNKRLCVHVYNKTDDFGFEVVRYTALSSNISAKISYNVFYGELIRFARITNDFSNFSTRVKKLLDDFIKKGFPQIKLLQKVGLFLENYCTIMYKFGIFSKKDEWAFLKKISQ